MSVTRTIASGFRSLRRNSLRICSGGLALYTLVRFARNRSSGLERLKRLIERSIGHAHRLRGRSAARVAAARCVPFLRIAAALAAALAGLRRPPTPPPSQSARSSGSLPRRRLLSSPAKPSTCSPAPVGPPNFRPPYASDTQPARFLFSSESSLPDENRHRCPLLLVLLGRCRRARRTPSRSTRAARDRDANRRRTRPTSPIFSA